MLSRACKELFLRAKPKETPEHDQVCPSQIYVIGPSQALRYSQIKKTTQLILDKFPNKKTLCVFFYLSWILYKVGYIFYFPYYCF